MENVCRAPSYRTHGKDIAVCTLWGKEKHGSTDGVLRVDLHLRAFVSSPTARQPLPSHWCACSRQSAPGTLALKTWNGWCCWLAKSPSVPSIIQLRVPVCSVMKLNRRLGAAPARYTSKRCSFLIFSEATSLFGSRQVLRWVGHGRGSPEQEGSQTKFHAHKRRRSCCVRRVRIDVAPRCISSMPWAHSS